MCLLPTCPLLEENHLPDVTNPLEGVKGYIKRGGELLLLSTEFSPQAEGTLLSKTVLEAAPILSHARKMA